MKIKVTATTALAVLFLASGFDPIRAEEMMGPAQKAAFSAGYVHQTQVVCPQITFSATLKVYIETISVFVSEDRNLWPYYTKGTKAVRDMSSNPLKHGIFCPRIGMEVEEIDKAVRSEAGVGDEKPC